LRRTNKLKEIAAKQNKPSSFVIFNPANITYLSGLQGATALLIPEDDQCVLYVSGVNCEQAKEEAKGFTVELIERGENLMEKIAKQASAKKLSVDALSIESWRTLAKAVDGEENLELAGDLIKELRKIKSQQEIDLIREACKIADIGAQTAQKTIREGITQNQVAAEVEYAMRKAGSEGTAFETIITSGYCCAYPHGSTFNRVIRNEDFVMVDVGATYKFYRSDITRTFILGQLSEKQTRLYSIVKQAYQKAFEAVKPKVAASEVDKAARKVIEDAGFGKFFVHNTGHGVGLEVHEGPILSPESKDILEEGNVITIEPGIYLPAFGGVRIEDTVVVTKSGAEKLTLTPYLM
jgi:Xaa-Pro dipeptidase